MAAERAASFQSPELAEAAGLLHDLGKYTTDFQRRIAGEAVRVDHATRGAMLAIERYLPMGYLLAYAIAGHHAGLANGAEAGDRTALRDRLRGLDLPPLLDAWRQEIDLPAHLPAPPLKIHSPERRMFQLAFLVRMLFSCLVDADYLDTENFYDSIEGRSSSRAVALPSLADLRVQLDHHLATFQPDTPINRIRANILRHVRDQAGLAHGLFSLTVPTGGGKTLVTLAFALDHALAHDLRRVIFVIPFTSIVEQNAAVFRGALGALGDQAVLEHHSAFHESLPADAPEYYQARQKLKLTMENWDAPIVVTTAVQFFESLFAARPSQCRKLHNIASSVIILDEAQTLPLKLLRPAVAAIDELARNYRCSPIICTATQPALNAPEFRGGLDQVRELAPDPPGLFRQLSRVQVSHIGILNDAELTDRLHGHERVLCIVNNRRHARAVFTSLCDQDGARHLTTLMCARHRSQALAEIRLRLQQGLPCRLVATSLIEAGVDISFPTLYRADAGLDAISQAGGRCNRHGEYPVHESQVLIFTPANEDWAPPPELRQFAQVGQEILRQHAADPLAPDAIEAYFQHLYWRKGEEALDAHNLLGRLQVSRIDSLPLETLAAKFRMIETVQMPVIVPFDAKAHAALEELHYATRCGGLARQLQPYLVQVPRQGYEALRQAGAIQAVAADRWGEQFMVLVNPDLYSEECGIWWEEPAFMNPANLII